MVRKAFTLIELLVVIAIIAILAAILFPVFAQAKEAAKKTSCLSNMKEMATAVYMYVGDADDYYPQTSWTKTPPNYSYQVHWTYLMQPYIKSYDIFKCPSDSTPVLPKHPCPNGVADFGKVPMICDWEAPKYSYITNYNAIPAHDWNPVSQTVYAEPANMIVFAERRATLPGGFVIGPQTGTSGFIPSQPCDLNYIKATPAIIQAAQLFTGWTDDESDVYGALMRVQFDRHTGGANYSYSDGHAKYQKIEQTLDPNHFQWGDRWYVSGLPGTCP